MASVKLVGIRKIYDEGPQRHVAVHALDLDIADGEFVVLVGPSGCGKSTTRSHRPRARAALGERERAHADRTSRPHPSLRR
jgi:ABC-type dipeptide/oligopeptide/nickel transport system ATPase subunit